MHGRIDLRPRLLYVSPAHTPPLPSSPATTTTNAQTISPLSRFDAAVFPPHRNGSLGCPAEGPLPPGAGNRSRIRPGCRREERPRPPRDRDNGLAHPRRGAGPSRRLAAPAGVRHRPEARFLDRRTRLRRGGGGSAVGEDHVAEVNRCSLFAGRWWLFAGRGSLLER